MNAIDWLKEGDVVFAYLVDTYLLDKHVPYHENGFIGRYLSRYDPKTKKWGNGYYGPKWISTHYTLLDLYSLKIDPYHPVFNDALTALIDYYWQDKSKRPPHKHLDLCIIGMAIKLLGYAKSNHQALPEMTLCLLESQLADGGWNCVQNQGLTPKNSSLHTTINVLEGLCEIVSLDNGNRQSDILAAIDKGNHYLFRKKLFRSERTGEIIHEAMQKFHFPVRWKYDALRALEYFSDSKVIFHSSMEETLNIVRKTIEKGYVTKGTTYSGKHHFSLETTRAGRFNTFRALKILKRYDPAYYQTIINQNFLKNPL